MISSLIYQAIIIIILLTFSFGPAFFALINTGIKHGYKTGAFLAIGVVFSDLLLSVLICFLVYFGMANLLHSEKTQAFFGIIGGVVLIVFGAFFFKKIPQKTDNSIDLADKLPSSLGMLLKGFFLNLFNPTVWLLWLANITAVSKSLDYNIYKMLFFFLIVLSLVLLVELFKVKLAGKIKKYLTNKVMTIVNYMTGTSLLIFGLLLIYNHFFTK